MRHEADRREGLPRMEPLMSRPIGTTLAFALFLTGLLGSGLAPARAADWDDDGPGYQPGYQYRRGWNHGGWNHGGWSRGDWDDNGGAVAAAVGGFALGAAAGALSQPRYGGCYFVERPVLDGWGNIVAYRRAQVCE